MKTETHHIRLHGRSCTCVIEQEPTRVLIRIRHDKIRHALADKATVMEWLRSILERFKDDPRHIEVVDLAAK